MTSYYRNETLFSEIYLEEITQLPEQEDAQTSLKVLREYRDYADTTSLEAWTQSYIHEVLAALGFFAKMAGPGLTLLYPIGRQDSPLSLCVVTRPETDLDENTIGRNHAAQTIRALRQHGLQWGLLTNGKGWRIYHLDEATPYETYLEIDLENILYNQAKTDYQIFHKFLKSDNFEVSADGFCQFDRFKKESKDKIDYIEKELANALKQREEGGKGVLSDLCMGYVDELRQAGGYDLDDEALRRKIYHGAMLYMFRLLFLFYAEARGLLSDENEASLLAIKSDVRALQKGERLPGGDYSLWERLSAIFVDIDQTYNGGLFSPQESEFTRFIEDTRAADRYLGGTLFNLITYREKNGQEKPISYRDMSVRHLGTLYEGLLEHKLFITAEATEVRVTKGKIEFIPASRGGKLLLGHTLPVGAVYFSGDPSERKATGSYYTPEYIVDYIVRNTVGEKLKEFKTAFREQEKANLQAFTNAKDADERAALSGLLEENALKFVREKILTLSVLDPAMGSGHFLVNVTNMIANFICEFLNDLGIEGEIESGAVYWRRWVVENCIYGVDLNPLAVELAKLALWILSMAKDQPLSFTNHHLKCGNSLVGARLDEIGNYPFSTAKKEPRQLKMFERDPNFRAAVEDALAKARLIASHASTTLEDVEEKKAWLAEIEDDLKGYKAICNIHTGLYFGCQVDETEYTRLVEKRDFARAFALEKPNLYFHWALEFPEVFFDTNKKDKILIIGNPPWGSDLSEEQKRFFMDKYEFVHMRTPDTFNYFLAEAYLLGLDKEEGILGVIIPNNFLFQHEFAKSRKFLLTNSSLKIAVNLGDSVFEATAPSCIVIAGSRVVGNKGLVYVADLRNENRDVLPSVLITLNLSGISEKEILATPDHVIQMDKSSSTLLTKILRSSDTTLGDLSDDVASGISSGGDKAYRISVHQAESLEIEKEILKPVLIGREIHEYFVPQNTGSLIIYSTKLTTKAKFPKTLKYLSQFEEKLSQKRETVKGLIPWWSLHWPRNPGLFETPKIVLRQTSDTLIAATDNYGYYCLNSVIIVKPKDITMLNYLVGLLNSSLMRWVYRNLTQEQNRVFAEVKPVNLRKLPIRLEDISKDEPKSVYYKIVEIVERVSILQSQRYTHGMVEEKIIGSLIAELNTQIYRLYDLSSEEIAIIETKG